jgi:hypothetical protein
MQEIKNSRQESSAQSSTAADIQAWIKLCIQEGVGRTRCRCGETIHPDRMGIYPHADGMEIKGKGKQWVYIRYPKCGYDWSLWTLHMDLDR